MIKFGNHKLGDDTAIFNMGTAKDCPSKKLGLCEVCNKGLKCYALKAEQQYPQSVPKSRENQKAYWQAHTADEIATDFVRKISRRRKRTTYFRFNESGDFESQSDVTKLSVVADALRTVGVTTYGYTARSDLDFRDARFLVKRSGRQNEGTGKSRRGDDGFNGECVVIEREEAVPEGFIECPGSCKRCNLCKIDVPHNIAFRKH